ncbi:hypothetical protein [Alteribacillus sp. YIM 98480]|uniref:hypothetical protein n=1 Tax=Alteribacillus sp. YIM 98480 TaxID=2606599 RepID=UPI00131BA5B4|nr:hypothetical protein [Alteribacillus sp. YIM 98480]
MKPRKTLGLLIAILMGLGIPAISVQAGEKTNTNPQWLPHTMQYAVDYMLNERVSEVEEKNDWNFILNTPEGEKVLKSKERTLSTEVGALFEQDGDTSYLDKYNDEKLTLRISNPDVLRLDKRKTGKITLAGGKTKNINVKAYAQKKGAAVLYLDRVKDGNVTTLAQTEIEIK